MATIFGHGGVTKSIMLYKEKALRLFLFTVLVLLHFIGGLLFNFLYLCLVFKFLAFICWIRMYFSFIYYYCYIFKNDSQEVSKFRNTIRTPSNTLNQSQTSIRQNK